MQQLDNRLNVSWWLLRIVFGLVPILAGLDKFLNFLADWPTYLSPAVQNVLPVGAASFMHMVGVIEIIAGSIVLSRWTLVGSYIVSAWLVAIALNLITTGQFFDIAVRDLVMAAAAYSLAQLTAVREGVTELRMRGMECRRAQSQRCNPEGARNSSASKAMTVSLLGMIFIPPRL